MHELAITESVVAGVCEHVGDAKVTRVVLEIGKLSAVMPEAVRFCFDVCAKGTGLEGATLDILETPGRCRCRTCNAEFQLEDSIALCQCGSADLEFMSGQQLLIKSVEVA
jgi:hydrogenase nickel incorporation protein HypA/HybF